jgi:hypothetical protein
VEWTVPSGVVNVIVDTLFLEKEIERRLHRSAELFKALVERETAVLTPA